MTTTTRASLDLYKDMWGVVEGFAGAMRTAASFEDNRLTREARDQQRVRLRDAAREAAVTAATAIWQEAHEAALRAEDAAAPHRPHLQPDDVAQLARSADAWQFNILPQLEAGKQWGQIIPTIGHDDAIAIERFAPSYLRAHTKMPHEVDAQLNLIAAGVQQRHADIATTPEGREAIRAAARAAHTARTVSSVAGEVSRARDASTLTLPQITLRTALAEEIA